MQWLSSSFCNTREPLCFLQSRKSKVAEAMTWVLFVLMTQPWILAMQRIRCPWLCLQLHSLRSSFFNALFNAMFLYQSGKKVLSESFDKEECWKKNSKGQCGADLFDALKILVLKVQLWEFPRAWKSCRGTLSVWLNSSYVMQWTRGCRGGGRMTNEKALEREMYTFPVLTRALRRLGPSPHPENTRISDP